MPLFCFVLFFKTLSVQVFYSTQWLDTIIGYSLLVWCLISTFGLLFFSSAGWKERVFGDLNTIFGKSVWSLASNLSVSHHPLLTCSFLPFQVLHNYSLLCFGHKHLWDVFTDGSLHSGSRHVGSTAPHFSASSETLHWDLMLLPPLPCPQICVSAVFYSRPQHLTTSVFWDTHWAALRWMILVFAHLFFWTSKKYPNSSICVKSIVHRLLTCLHVLWTKHCLHFTWITFQGWLFSEHFGRQS